jgi:predicted nuclease of predicted toxin-antitoxin system
MLVLFDNGTPRTLARYLIDRHAVTEARARGWQELENGILLNEAEAAGFEVLVTTDKNLSYQQNLTGRKIAVVVLGKGRWTLIQPHVAQVVAAVNAGQLYRGGNSVHVKPCSGSRDS